MRSEDTLIRRENLQRLMDARGWEVADLRSKLGYGRYTYWRDLLESPEKSFGEKAARKIESAAGLPPRWLDDPAGGPLVAAAPDTLLPLRETEHNLLMFYRLLKPDDAQEVLAEIEQLVLTTHGPLIEAMTRLKLNNRADDGVVHAALGHVEKKARKAAPKEIKEKVLDEAHAARSTAKKRKVTR